MKRTLLTLIATACALALQADGSNVVAEEEYSIFLQR